MEKLIGIALLLFILHTLEEAIFGFWNTDASTLWASGFTGLPPIMIYWLVQLVLYFLLLLILFVPRIRGWSWALALLGVVLLFEFQHLIVAVQSQHYEAGLYSGSILGLFGVFYLVQLFGKRRPHGAELP